MYIFWSTRIASILLLVMWTRSGRTTSMSRSWVPLGRPLVVMRARNDFTLPQPWNTLPSASRGSPPAEAAAGAVGFDSTGALA